MKKICFNFLVHQPYRLKNFRFFEIGSSQNYFDEEKNAAIMHQVSGTSYLSANQLLLETINTNKDQIKVSFSISGTALDQMEQYAPEVLESFKKLPATKQVEFLGQTYGASLSSLKSKTAFNDEVVAHKRRILEVFGQEPQVFLNTGLIYSDEIGVMVGNLGFKGMIVDGQAKILNGLSPNFVYKNPSTPSIGLLLRNQSLSDDIATRFSQTDWIEWPLTADKYLKWLKSLDSQEEVVTLVMDYAIFGEHQKKETGIFDFLRYLLYYLAETDDLKLSTPSEVLETSLAQAKLNISDPVSWAGKEKDLSTWLRNEMQQEAVETLYQLEGNIKGIKDKSLLNDWSYLLSADHFLYMNNEGEFINECFNPYGSPYEAFLRYMNVLSDFTMKLETKNAASSL